MISGLGASAGSDPYVLPRLQAFDYPFPPLETAHTLPALPDEARDFRHIEFAFHWRQPQAQTLMADFLGRFPASAYAPYVKLMLADTYFFNKEYTRALEIYNEIADNAFSGDIRTGMLFRKGFALMKNGYYPEAASLFSQAATSEIYGEAATLYLAYIDYVEGRYDDAYTEFLEIKERCSGKELAMDADFYLNQIDYQRGQYEKVARASETLLKGDVPQEFFLETLRVAGLSNFKLGEKQKAKSYLTKYVKQAGDGAEYAAMYALGALLYDEGKLSDALPLFRAVTEFDGALAQSAWLYVGQILSLQGDTRAASIAFEKAGRESWDSSVAEIALYNYAVGSASGNSMPFALSADRMEQFLDIYPDSSHASEVSRYLANSYYNLHDYEAALKRIDRISNPDATTRATRQKILYQMGVEQCRKGDFSAAVKTLKEASSPSAPDKDVAAQASVWLGEALYALKDYSAAAKAYEAALNSGKAGDNTALAYYDLGYAYMKTHDYAKAGEAFRKAAALHSLSPELQTDARLRLADCLYYLGKYADALAIYRDVRLQGGQEGVYARLRESDILGKEGKVNDKISILEALIDDEYVGIWRNTVISRLADTYSETGDDRKAASLYSLLLESGPDASDAVQTYLSLSANADNLYRRGDTAAAYDAYRKIADSGIEDLYTGAVLGLARTSSGASERARYATLAASLAGLTAEEMNEARFIAAEAGLSLGGAAREDALSSLRSLANGSDPLWSARAAVLLGETLLAQGNTDDAEEVLTALIDNGTSDNYWLARGYIALADVYAAQGKDYLAKLYIESLRDNYPGSEKDIQEMIKKRL